MKINFSGVQAFSRNYSVDNQVDYIQSTLENPIKYQVKYELLTEPFSIQIAGLIGRNVSIGAFEYFDGELDKYLSERWPAQRKISGWVERSEDFEDNDALLNFARKLLWFNDVPGILMPADQLSATLGYRREFHHHQHHDISNLKRPSPTNFYYQTDLNEPYGPGVVMIENVRDSNLNNELVWSEILKFPNRTTFEKDKKRIHKNIEAHYRHYNSHIVLQDCEQHIKNGSHRAAIWAAAAAVDASLLRCIEMYGLKNKMPLPKSFGGFDEKISKALELAGLPDFTSLEPEHAKNIRHLYRARNKQHEADCYYSTDEEKIVKIYNVEQVRPLANSAKAFVLWIDTIL